MLINKPSRTHRYTKSLHVITCPLILKIQPELKMEININVILNKNSGIILPIVVYIICVSIKQMLSSYFCIYHLCSYQIKYCLLHVVHIIFIYSGA
jgi:hypothetical protein